jgi:hypothetical protein
LRHVRVTDPAHTEQRSSKSILQKSFDLREGIEMAGEEVAGEEHAAAEDGNAELEEDEGERGADGDGLGNALPAARVKRIMRKNPDKKKNFSKECVLAVSMATVSSRPRPRPHLRSAMHPGILGLAPRAPRARAAPPEPACRARAPAVPGAVPERHCRKKPREHVGQAAQDHAAAGHWCVPCDRTASAPWSAGVLATVMMMMSFICS